VSAGMPWPHQAATVTQRTDDRTRPKQIIPRSIPQQCRYTPWVEILGHNYYFFPESR